MSSGTKERVELRDRAHKIVNDWIQAEEGTPVESRDDLVRRIYEALAAVEREGPGVLAALRAWIDQTRFKAFPVQGNIKWDVVSSVELIKKLDEWDAALEREGPGREDLSFAEFSKINRQRCESKDGFSHSLGSWSTSDWFLALFGELGEAANVAKKLNRFRDGIPGNKQSKEELEKQLRDELGDSFVYLDLLAQSLGIAIGEAAAEVFNAKSEQLCCPIRLERAAQSPVAPEEEGQA